MLTVLFLIVFLFVPIFFIYICLSDGKIVSAVSGEGVNSQTGGFWRRQFSVNSTFSQKRFDWLFGFVMPVICFFFDPIVFRVGFSDDAGILQTFKPFAYILSYVSVMAMAAWLLWGEKLKWFNAVLSGLFAVGAVVSLVVGIVLFPLSLIGLLMLIGALGFTPLLTSIVFLRNARRAFAMAKPFVERKVLIYAFAVSALYTAVVPAVINIEINNFYKARADKNFSLQKTNCGTPNVTLIK